MRFSTRALLLGVSCCFVLVCVPGAVLSQAADDTAAIHSVGRTRGGRIEGGGAELPLRGPGFHWETNRGNPGARFGTPSLVQALLRAAAAVAERYPGSDLAILDLSRRGGGAIAGHGSHTSGRDVDVAYYAQDFDGTRLDPTRILWFQRTGLMRGAASERAPRLDGSRTWLFLATLASDPEITLRFVFAAPGLQRLLLEQGAGSPAHATLTRVFRTPHGRDVDPHADHFHVRIECPAGDDGCRP